MIRWGRNQVGGQVGGRGPGRWLGKGRLGGRKREVGGVGQVGYQRRRTES